MCFPTTPFAHFSSFPALPRSWKCVLYYGFPDIGQRCEHFVETVCLVFPSMCFPSTPFPYFFCRVSSPLFVALSTGCLGPSWGLLGPVLGHLGGRVGPLLGHLGAVSFQHPARSNTIGSPKESIELAHSGFLGLCVNHSCSCIAKCCGNFQRPSAVHVYVVSSRYRAGELGMGRTGGS